MVTYKPSRKNKEIFKKVIRLRDQGFSYGEINKVTNISKSTIHDWLFFAGLTLTQKHFEIQSKKRAENYLIGNKASIILRKARKENEISNFVNSVKVFFNNPQFVAGIILYEAEGSKGTGNSFSNSDFRLIKTYIIFLKKYLNIDKDNLSLRLYIHKSRNNDLKRICNFWSKKLNVKIKKINISWKNNIISKVRNNLDYVGQFEVRIRNQKYFTSKMTAISDIILRSYTNS